ncbi:FAD/NAD(P)-binding protein [Tianweitania sp.]|uniref:FAD/NAD(P)-binding protein n=1 Tax=Tianweitania sp. TaxID=2021634 RepID=UPI002898D566|nr:FAD/NAD(P)-binding protein [Tianweitania sp.]
MVIGGGASGVLAAVQLLSRPQIEKVVLFERGDLAAGIAYGTEHPGHLLNVRAERMSAFPDQPSHFQDWIGHVDQWKPEGGWTGHSYVPRRLYCDYLQSLIAPFLNTPRLEWVRSDVATLDEDGGGVSAVTKDGARYTAEAAILATGNEAPSLPDVPWRHVGWSNAPIPSLSDDAPIAIVGTGLSMVDAVVSLLDRGHKGPITAISRRGLLPQPHRSVEPMELSAADVPKQTDLIGMVRWLRKRVLQKQAEGFDWRGVVDSLRPHTQALWQGLSDKDHQRFLRHVRPFWDVHRHRMAPQIYARLAAAQADGQLRIISARVAAVEGNGEGAVVTIEKRGTHQEQRIEARLVIECRGASGDLARTHNPLLAELRDAAILHRDPLGLGIHVTPEGATIRGDGSVSDRLFAVGPITAGCFWEIIAIPDIRGQVADLAQRLAGDAQPMDGACPDC